MKVMFALGLAALGLSLTATKSEAALAPINAFPQVATSAFTVVFVFKAASDSSTLSYAQPPGSPPTLLITNQTDPVAKSVGPVGASGPVAFILNNNSTGYSFTAGIADPVDGDQHFVSTNNFADFNTGTVLGAATLAAIATAGPGFFVGVEDRRGGDRDFNDLIYWFAQIQATTVPTPGALALFGAGLLGLGLVKRKKAA